MIPSYHMPVLLQPSIELLAVEPTGMYVDATFGGGGHSGELLSRLSTGRIIAFDQDPDAKVNAIDDPRFMLIPKNFRDIEQALASLNISSVDGILADLGVSSHQFDTPERGFSYRYPGHIDMRMNPDSPLSAVNLLNEASEEKLIDIFQNWGEIFNAKKLARVISTQRQLAPITQTQELAQAISSCIPPKRRAKYLAQVYQALRIEVNREMEALSDLLSASVNLLKASGRIAIISYHSLEDRMVKHFFRSGNFHDVLTKDMYGNPITPWKLLTRKAIKPSQAEIERNPRARSARLRAAEKK